MRILAIGDPHGDLEKIKKIPIKNVNLILLTGDLGKADLARKRAFENIERRKNGLKEIEDTPKDIKLIYQEIYFSSISILEYLSKFAPVYSILGNVETSEAEVRKDEKKYNIKLPYLIFKINSLKDVSLIKNRVRDFDGIRVGGLEYFIDDCWIKEFREKDKKRMKNAKRETEKAKRILNNFKNLDILLCHQSPYGILDKVGNKAPRHWRGKHAGSKVILDYIKKYRPRYVLCGHIHEGEGKKKIGKTEVYNLGFAGHVFLNID